jgi:uncharacterized protein (TIGR02266 family)
MPALTTAEPQRHADRAREIILQALVVLQEELADEDGPMTRCCTRLERASQGLRSEPDVQAVQETHHALSDALAVGRAVSDLMSDRGRLGLDALGKAQSLLYPIAKELGVPSPPPLPRAYRPASVKPASAEDERRASPRVDLVAEVSFRGETNFFQGFSEDLSDGGLFVQTYRLQPIGTTIDLEFSLPDGHIVRTTAEVRWHRDPRDDDAEVHPGMGLRFGALMPEDARAIQTFVSRRAPLFYDE